MAAEALIVEDAYQRGYADAIADMRKKKEQRRQREQAKKARRWYFIKQKAYGLAMLAVTVLAAWATEGDITIAVITVPLGLMCLFSKKMMIVDDYYFATEERATKNIKRKAGRENEPQILQPFTPVITGNISKAAGKRDFTYRKF